MFVGILSIIGIISITGEDESISLHHELGDMAAPNSNHGEGGISGNMDADADMDMANMGKHLDEG